MVLDIVESGSTAAASSSSHGNHHPALIARIYGSHIHEDKSLPQATLTIPDVHALHRTQSRFVCIKCNRCRRPAGRQADRLLVNLLWVTAVMMIARTAAIKRGGFFVQYVVYNWTILSSF